MLITGVSFVLDVWCRGCDAGNSFLERAVDTALLSVGAIVGDQTLLRVLAAASSINASLAVILQADNDFYSQADQLAARGLPLTAAALATLPRCLPCPTGPTSNLFLSTVCTTGKP